MPAPAPSAESDRRGRRTDEQCQPTGRPLGRRDAPRPPQRGPHRRCRTHSSGVDEGRHAQHHSAFSALCTFGKARCPPPVNIGYGRRHDAGSSVPAPPDGGRHMLAGHPPRGPADLLISTSVIVLFRSPLVRARPGRGRPRSVVRRRRLSRLVATATPHHPPPVGTRHRDPADGSVVGHPGVVDPFISGLHEEELDLGVGDDVGRVPDRDVERRRAASLSAGARAPPARRTGPPLPPA